MNDNKQYLDGRHLWILSELCSLLDRRSVGMRTQKGRFVYPQYIPDLS